MLKMDILVFLLPLLAVAAAQRPRLIYIDEDGKPLCPCARILLPVCGSDGKTYNNKCQLLCQQNLNPGLRTVHNGNCRETRSIEVANVPNLIQVPNEGFMYGTNLLEDKKPNMTCACPGEYKLTVCGADGKTYENPCKAICGGTISRSIGACPDPSRTYNGSAPCECENTPRFPVCGKDGDYLMTFTNPCTLNCHIATVAPNMRYFHGGICEELKPPAGPCGCPRESQQPVCGSDGLTYHSLCELDCLAKEKGVHMKYTGPCIINPNLIMKKIKCANCQENQTNAPNPIVSIDI